MKKIISVLLVLFALFILASCTTDDEPAVTTGNTDWRNTIEYEGAFYVNEKTRVLYAFDKGSITLWDNAGSGNVLQTIEYDTSVADAVERIEKEDINGDGNCDIRVIYSESEEGTRYNLFLWSEKTGRFAPCRIYSEITDPVIEENTGYVIGVWDMAPFGIVTKKYEFNENCGLDLVESIVSEPQKTAVTIATTFDDSVVSVSPASGKATIEGETCDAFVANTVAKTVAYITYTADGRWYMDKGCFGFYREVLAEDGNIVFGDYLGECKSAQVLAEVITGKSVEIHSATAGEIDGQSAKCYVMITSEGESVYLAGDKRGFWYLAEDAENYIKVNASTGVAVGDETYSFAVSEEE